MPGKAKNSKIKKSNAANKSDIGDIDEVLNDVEFMKSLEELDKKTPSNKHNSSKNKVTIQRSGADNARIGMEGFKAATTNPQMFSEALGMLNDPKAVKEAQLMMNDPEFKMEIQKHMASLKSDPSFQTAMEAAQSKFKDIAKDPKKMGEFEKKIMETVPSLNDNVENYKITKDITDPGI
mmetsp:Transcript_7270/g.10831  ORF Transcript_7270/g.10831 Transcript_7270/m.10831 type:complete len:179 (+) Transcript_7270:172-708(+)|eukprot:CAMPEP_0171454874 /NCGR_PEP_ID=MMETSP0945-20130129/1987_1 /TAXON_ID=109269 /ORGANISM="Vaucheria litorea, Strain CCMP2940" /LENGTH=178 /DNA_ID=CAMNT_0011979987 /DNA_START=167 /DNA_END=703 /DNA_ORIENTATION=-